ncbi:unnamed protein product [Euphydryas editha]|uniref:Uncharacterized protein n=1 Tax=Euphydryas editha TaxID=104508 RepID=A0AAU9UHG1_EUPED|nr:unnamed protein product [Euphydryas editha]
MAFTRKNLKCPIFGESAELRNNLLPTYESIADIFTNKIDTLWIKSSIPIVTHKRVLQILKCYHSKCYNLKKSLKKLKKEKLEEFRVKSRMLFDIAACKCKEFQSCTCRKEKKVPKEEQIFLKDQRTNRLMVIETIDIIQSKKLQNRQLRALKQEGSSITTAKNQEKPATSYRSNRNRFDYNLDLPSCSSTTQDINTCTTASQKKSISIKLTDASLHSLTTVCDRYGVSDRAAAAIVSSVLRSTSNADSEVQLTNVVDRMKLRRMRKKVRKQILIEEKIMYIPALYFDGRKDRTAKIILKGTKRSRMIVQEEHITIIKEPGYLYVGYVVPESGTSKNIEKAIYSFLATENMSLESLMAVGCDDTNINTGKVGGVIYLLKRRLSRPLQWIICLLHANELPLRHLFTYLDGPTAGPKSFVGRIGKATETCETLPLIQFLRIEGEQLPPISTDISTDKKYLYEITTAVMSGSCPPDLIHRSSDPPQNLVKLATFIIKSYAPVWFAIKVHSSCKDGSRHLWKLISSTKYLPDELLKIVDPVIIRNSYFAHSENLLLSMITDSQKHIRELTARRILKARQRDKNTVQRKFKLPKINLNASSYIDLIDWQQDVHEPPIIKNISQ